MKPDFEELDRRVAQARIVLSLIVLLSIYVDPSTGGLFHVTEWQFITLACHLFYSSLMYLFLSRGLHIDSVRKISAALDLLFATAVALVTEGRTSPSFVFFVFAIVAAGLGASFRHTLMTTFYSVALYIMVIALSNGLMNDYLMRAVYLAIVGFLIGFFGEQRINFETRLRELETAVERHTIARTLHDGYIQALAGISLRLESCRDMLVSNQPEEALAEVGEIQLGVNREYDVVREYVRNLASNELQVNGKTFARLNTKFQVYVAFTGAGPLIEHIVQIVLEGIRNTQLHGKADSAVINVSQARDTICITIDDDGVGFGELAKPPWTIASHVAEFGGKLTIKSDAPGAHLEIAIPTA